jgi:multidrug efflux pump subunit AcrB
LENIFRHLELGESPEVAAERGGSEVALPVLAATLTTAVVFFPVTFLFGVSKFLFTALALAVVLSLFASYFVAMTVVPLFCAKLIKTPHGLGEESGAPKNWGERFTHGFNRRFQAMLGKYDRALGWSLARSVTTVVGITGVFVLSLGLFPLVGTAYFPKTDPGQFVINIKAPTGTRIELTEQYAQKVEQIIRETVSKDELDVIVSNIGTTPDFSAIYSPNAAQRKRGLYEPRATAHAEGVAPVERLFPNRRFGGCHS